MTRTNISYALFGLLAICFAFFLVAPNTTQAYYTTDQTVTKLTDQAALYTISYRFGLQNDTIYMPVLATRALIEDTPETDRVAYTLRTDQDAVTEEGSVAGFVVSNAPIVDGMYKINAGISYTMTLVVLLTTPEDAEPADYGVQVEKLNYLVDTGEPTLEVRGLNEHELASYKTNKVELND